MANDRLASRSDFLEVTRELEERLRPPRKEEPSPIEEPATFVATPLVDTSVGNADPSSSPNDVGGLPEVDEPEEFERRYSPPVEIFPGQPGHPDELVERKHLDVLGTDFPVQLGEKPSKDKASEDLAASYGG